MEVEEIFTSVSTHPSLGNNVSHGPFTEKCEKMFSAFDTAKRVVLLMPVPGFVAYGWGLN